MQRTMRLKFWNVFCFGALALLLFGLTAPSATAQNTLDFPMGEFHSYGLDSRALVNMSQNPVVAYQEVIHVPNAAWIRLYFDKVVLEKGSVIRMTSAYDAEIQELDAAGIDMWNNTSAYFNGDSVLLEVVAAPGTALNQVVLDRVAVHITELSLGICADDDCGICGTDNRTLSSELWTGRIVPVGCTGSIISTDSCVVSAGHCVGGDTTLQFNVPASASNCGTYNPPVADQFPITGRQYTNGGVGNDWAVMTVGTNNLGETPYERYGQLRPIATALAGSGDPCDNWGYGVDNNNPTRSQVQQTHSGDVLNRYSDYYTFDLDMTYGNSGSALLKNDEIIGIITHCSFSCENYATRVDLSAFAAARASLCGGGSGGYCAASSGSTAYEYISRVQVGSIDNSSGASTYSDFTGQSTDMSIGSGYSITVSLSSPYATDIGGLWIDWNQDEDFSDSGETMTTSWSGTGPYTTTIIPPAGAALGSTRMRMRIQDGDYTPTLSPCGSSSYGEVEDYSVNVVSGGGDTTPPTPNPMQWTTVPYATGANSVSMLAVTATDADSPPVQYQFDSSFSGSSAWQTSRTFSQSGLTANTSYSYEVRARDSASTPNNTSWSSSASIYTFANTPSAPTVSGATASSLNVNVNPNGNPSSTQIAVYCTTQGQYVNASGGFTGSAVWQTDSQWGTTTVGGLAEGMEYCFQAKARNGNNIETSFGSQGCGTTGVTGPTVTAAIICEPDTGTLPFVSAMSVWLTNNYTGQTRRISARINFSRADGAYISNWKSGWTNVDAGSYFYRMWNQSFPSAGAVVGDNIFQLEAFDVTPAPYNQPPHPPEGDSDTDTCTVTGIAP